ncbi:heparan sulfate sulfotransferase [Aureococcus anophagefferens]|nr:heparan sulfate sulfotransferase [Aureococcus anophagefferens]
MTARRDATAPRDAGARGAAPTRFPRLSRITNSMGCVRLICVLETLIVALCLLEAHALRRAVSGLLRELQVLTARRGAYDVAVDATATYFRDPRAAVAPLLRRRRSLTTLLAVLRDPAARLYSEYAVIRSRQPDRFGNATFARAVDGWLSDRGDAEGRRLLAVGHYVDQLLAWHRHLPREALYVVPAAALDDDATHVRGSRRAHAASPHLPGVSAPPRRPPGEAAAYAARTGDAMDDATRRRLAAYYAPHDARLWAHLADHRDLVIPRAFQVAPGDPTTHWW